jgi:hypothetical protein
VAQGVEHQLCECKTLTNPVPTKKKKEATKVYKFMEIEEIRERIQKFLEANENENIILEYLGYTEGSSGMEVYSCE